jgi:hypothetical protein
MNDFKGEIVSLLQEMSEISNPFQYEWVHCKVDDHIFDFNLSPGLNARGLS